MNLMPLKTVLFGSKISLTLTVLLPIKIHNQMQLKKIFKIHTIPRLAKDKMFYFICIVHIYLAFFIYCYIFQKYNIEIYKIKSDLDLKASLNRGNTVDV